MTVAVTSVVCAVVAILLATWLFAKPNSKPEKMQAALPRLHKWAYNRFYMDNVYQFVTHRIIFAYISRPIAWFDRHIIDGTMDMFATVTNAVAEKIKGFQSGKLQMYVWIYIVGAMILAAAAIYALCIK
jgi:NADH-quinone oxidoreductase subunit L